jgi:hypothetical protein
MNVSNLFRKIKLKTKKRKSPVKKCQKCGTLSHARCSTCECGHVFYQKKQKNKVINDWQNLQKGDIIKSVKGYGPYWMNPTTEEKVYMGSYGKFTVRNIGKNYIVAHQMLGKSIDNAAGTFVLYMGGHKKSPLADNMWRSPHKLVRI